MLICTTGSIRTDNGEKMYVDMVLMVCTRELYSQELDSCAHRNRAAEMLCVKRELLPTGDVGDIHRMIQDRNAENRYLINQRFEIRV